MKKIVNKIEIEELTKKTHKARELIHEVHVYLKENLREIIEEASEDYKEIIKKRIAEALENDDMKAAQSLINDIKEHVENLKKPVTIEEALEIMGHEQFIGPEDIQNTFGFRPATIPEIPFSPSELERAKELGQQLILYVDTKADGTPFAVEDMHDILDGKASDGGKLLYSETHTKEDSVLATQAPRLGWRLTTPEIIEGSTDKNYLEQIETLIGYLKKEHFKGVDMPKVYEEAIDEFNSVNTPELKEKVNSTKESEWQEAARILSELSINQLTRERSSEIIYRSAINEKKLGVKNLTFKYAWSISLDAGGKLVRVGYFVDSGLIVGRRDPRYSRGILGVCLSIGAIMAHEQIVKNTL